MRINKIRGKKIIAASNGGYLNFECTKSSQIATAFFTVSWDDFRISSAKTGMIILIYQSYRVIIITLPE